MPPSRPETTSAATTTEGEESSLDSSYAGPPPPPPLQCTASALAARILKSSSVNRDLNTTTEISSSEDEHDDNRCTSCVPTSSTAGADETEISEDEVRKTDTIIDLAKTPTPAHPDYSAINYDNSNHIIFEDNDNLIQSSYRRSLAYARSDSVSTAAVAASKAETGSVRDSGFSETASVRAESPYDSLAADGTLNSIGGYYCGGRQDIDEILTASETTGHSSPATDSAVASGTAAETVSITSGTSSLQSDSDIGIEEVSASAVKVHDAQAIRAEVSVLT